MNKIMKKDCTDPSWVKHLMNVICVPPSENFPSSKKRHL